MEELFHAEGVEVGGGLEADFFGQEVEVLGQGIGHKHAFVDDDHMVAHRLHLLHDVGGEQHGAVLAVGADKFADFNELVRIETGGGLVQNQHFGVVDERLRDADTLFVTARQGPDFLVLLGGEAGALDDFFLSFRWKTPATNSRNSRTYMS